MRQPTGPQGHKSILLGLTFSDQKLLPALPANSERRAFSPSGLIRYLEGFYALGAPSLNRTALRAEQYRQVLRRHLEDGGEETFYANSFVSDAFATAEELLSRRDELLDAGYELAREPEENCPARIRTLHELEAIVLEEEGPGLLAGNADRLNLLLGALSEDHHPRLAIHLNEPRELLPPGVRRLLDKLEAVGDTVQPLPEPAAPYEGTDLGRWQIKLRGGKVTNKETVNPQGDLFSAGAITSSSGHEATLTGDGSLLLLRASRETHIAAYLAKTFKENPDFRPGALLTVRNQTLDNALLSEGLPSLGVPSTSLARPSLQVLKLVTAFLWEPIEVARIMEFVSLVTKPLHWQLAQRIAEHLADTPGFFSQRWFQMIERFFDELNEDGGYTKDQITTIRKQYEGWFRRKRYGRGERVPKYDLRLLFNDLREWAFEERTERRKKDVRKNRKPGDYSGLLVLAAQAQRALELLDAQPEADLSFLDVERLVRTVYEPAPTQFYPEEQGGLATIFAPASAAKISDGEGVNELLWWDFIEHDPDYFFSRYYPEELSWLTEHDAKLNTPSQQNDLSAWQALRPVLHPRNRLVLCLPERVDGAAVEAHPLFGDLEAAFPEGALNRITINIDEAGQAVTPDLPFTLPTFEPVAVRPLDRPVPQLKIGRMADAPPRDTETPTALEDLLYYPHKWVFRHQLELRGTPILSIASENRLRGNLSHLFIERLLNEVKAGKLETTKPAVYGWIEANAGKLLQQEGAVMLEYGQEPERIQFVRTMKYSAWSLVHHIQENGWRIRGSEEKVAGELTPMGGQEVKGRADLVLERVRNGEPEVVVVDLKWRGKTVFKNLLRNAKDVQLCLYAEFIRQNKTPDGAEALPTPKTVHTAYYVLRDALMLSRNELAFANIETVAGADEAGVVQQEMLRKIRSTFNWRWEQFHDGNVEVRCADTIGHLDDLYLDEPHDERLEMETEDARFDDYRSLVGLVR